MASGFSWSGGRPRCYVYWQEFQRCYAQNPSECGPSISDYLECLHHRKEIRRAEDIQGHILKGKQEAKAGHKATGVNSEGASAAVELRKEENEPAVDKK